MEKHHVQPFSSNYTLYADMSKRVMQTLSDFTPNFEIYSIDEAFLDLSGIQMPLEEYGRQIRNTVKQWTGIPVSVGIAPTKTLTKIANKLAKKSPKANGVLNLVNSPYIEQALKRVEVVDVWGVGYRSARKLNKAGIYNALDLSHADIGWIKKKFGVQGVRTIYELQGIQCYPLEENPPSKKSLAVSRMFGRKVESVEELSEAVATYASRAGEKLREGRLSAGLMTVFITTSRFIEKRYFNSYSIEFPVQTNDTQEIIQAALSGLKRIYRKGYEYKKAGVVFHNLVNENKVPLTEEVAELLVNLQSKRPVGYPYVYVPTSRYDEIQQIRNGTTSKRGKKTWIYQDARLNIIPNFTDLYNEIRNQAGVKKHKTFHDLRRTAITNFFRQKMDIVDVMKLAGHSKYETTLKYYLAVEEDLVDKARKAVKFKVSREMMERCKGE